MLTPQEISTVGTVLLVGVLVVAEAKIHWSESKMKKEFKAARVPKARG